MSRPRRGPLGPPRPGGRANGEQARCRRAAAAPRRARPPTTSRTVAEVQVPRTRSVRIGWSACPSHSPRRNEPRGPVPKAEWIDCSNARTGPSSAVDSSSRRVQRTTGRLADALHPHIVVAGRAAVNRRSPMWRALRTCTEPSRVVPVSRPGPLLALDHEQPPSRPRRRGRPGHQRGGRRPARRRGVRRRPGVRRAGRGRGVRASASPTSSSST